MLTARATQTKGVGAVTAYVSKIHESEHKLNNLMQSVVLVAGLGLLLAFCAWLLWSWTGVIVMFVAVGFLVLMTPQIPPQVVMGIYRARPIDPRHGSQFYRIIEELSTRADLPKVPALYVVPSMALNAFATGRRENSAIAITEGMLRKLSVREITGVLGHEISHIRNNDVWVMGLADVMSRLMQSMSVLAIVLFFLHLPGALMGRSQMPWLGILLLYLAPAIASLLQFGLSRAREYDADLEGAHLTGDPIGLASALRKLERYQGRLWEDLLPTGRRIPQPSVLRSHPTTERRIERLLEIRDENPLPPIDVSEEPMVTMVGAGPGSLRPRYRLPGLWF